MRRIILCLTFSFSLLLSTAAQSTRVEPAQPEELKGVVRIYIQTDEDKARRNIANEIEQRLPQLTFVAKAEDAQVVLTFQQIRRRYRGNAPAPRGSVERRGSTQQIDSRSPATLPSGEFEIIALGAVIKPDGTTSRRLLRFEDTLSSALEDKLSTDFARAFIKLYKKANHK